MSDDKRDSSNETLQPPHEHEKVTVTLRLDSDIMNWFLEQGNEEEHINNSLRKYIEVKQKQEEKLTDIKEVKELLTMASILKQRF